MAESTFAKICEILKEQDGVTEELTPETTFEEAGIDSLATVEVVMACEEVQVPRPGVEELSSGLGPVLVHASRLDARRSDARARRQESPSRPTLPASSSRPRAETTSRSLSPAARARAATPVAPREIGRAHV